MRRLVDGEIDIAKTRLMENFFRAYKEEDEARARIDILHDYDKMAQLITAKHYWGWDEETLVGSANWKDRDIRRYLGWPESEIDLFRRRQREEESLLSMGFQSARMPAPAWLPFDTPESGLSGGFEQTATGTTGAGSDAERLEPDESERELPAPDGSERELPAPDDGTPDGEEAGSTPRFEVFPWALSAMEFIIDAQARVDRQNPKYDPIAAVGSLYAAKRELLEGEEQVDPDSVALNAKAILNESETMSNRSRRKAIRDFVADGEEVREGVQLNELLRASEILHEHYIEQYKRIENLRVNLLTFLALTIVSVVGILALPWFLPDMELTFPLPTFEGVGPYGTAILVLVFGAVGASISGIRAIETEPESLQSMTQILGYWLPISRIVIGSVSAFLVSVFLGAGLVEGDLLTLPVLLGVAFASGFSERLILRSVESFERIPTGGAASK